MIGWDAQLKASSFVNVCMESVGLESAMSVQDIM